MANVIIGIHGLGNKPPKELLEYWWKLAMIEGLKTNNYNPILPKFELVYWTDILYDKPLNESEKDEDSPYFLKEKYVKAPKDFPIESYNTRRKIIDFIGRQINHIFLNEDFSLNYSTITDAILSKYFKDLDIYYTENCTLENASICKAKNLINNRLIQVLEKYKNDDIMLISHSMGSIIAFDVLNFEAPQNIVDSFVTIGSPLGIPIVISKIAAEQKQRLNGVNHMNTPPPVAKNWYNFSDILDKVALNYKLADDFSENDRGIKPIDFLVVNNYEMNGKRNPHKAYGYLRAPEFSKVLNDFILTEKLTMKQKIIRKTKQIIYRAKAKIY
ncbi:MAG: hypothetical protein HQ543_06025 [Bacteroidetes bacterium]|nr:hypothetical protein [Bacteroidota bacterium]